MRTYAHEYDSATALAEATVDNGLLEEEVLNDETHWVWDEALKAKERDDDED